MPKRINYANRSDGIIPNGDVGALLNPNKLNAYFNTLGTKPRARMIAFLHSFYTAPEISAMFSVSPSYVRQCSHENRDIIEAAQLGRNFAIADMSERRVVELLQKMNVDNIPDEKKAVSIRHLMESSDMARGQTSSLDKKDDENVMELVFSIKQKMKLKKRERDRDNDEEDDEEQKEPIDITDEMKEINK
jgi:hypothetical protein